MLESAVKQALQMKRMAVVGLSKDPGKAAHGVPRYLQQRGYKIYPVNPFGGDVLLGERVYDNIKDISDPVDLVLIFRPSHEVLGLVEEALTRSDVKGIWLQEGITSSAAETLCKEQGILFVQDRCMYKEHVRQMD
mgnify:CR=1 FL=1